MMIRRFIVFLLFLGMTFVLCPGVSIAQEGLPNFDPEASEILQGMSKYMDSLGQFSFHSENTTDEVRTSGQKLQFADAVDVSIRRPDRIRANVIGDFRHQEFYYDGKSISLFAKDKNVYASLDAPETIEAAMNHAFDAFGLQAPLADFIFRKSHEILANGALSGSYLGLHYVQGTKCHHLAITRGDIDLQIWIEDGETPLPRKLIITEKWVTGAPQFTALMSNWNLSPQLNDDLFNFVPPENAEKIKFAPVSN